MTMISLVNNLLPLIFLFNCSSSSILVNRSLNLEIIQCSPNRTVTIELSNGYSKKTVSYEEGIIETFTFSDSSCIFIFFFLMQTLPILIKDKYQVVETKDETGVMSRSGANLETSKLWREDNYKSGITIVYDNVPKSRLTEFNSMMESVEIKEQ